MNAIGGYFINKSEDGVGIKDNMIIGKKYRFTILTDRLVRLEYSPNGIFEDRPTQRVIFRKFPKVNFKVTHSEMLVQVITSYFTLDYVKEKPFGSSKFTPGNNLRITLKNSDRIWYYPHPEARNFGGMVYSLDDFSGNLKLGKGLYSTDGFAYIDDSSSLVLNQTSNFIKRENKELDLYVFMYRKDLGLALQDYYTLTGYPFFIPRYALGNWWYKDSAYTKQELEKILTKFKENNIPLSVILLGNKSFLENEPFDFSNDLDFPNLQKISKEHQVRLGLVANIDKKIKSGSNTYNSLTTNISSLNGDYSFLPLDNTKLNIYATYGFRKWISEGIEAFLIDYNNKKDKETIALLNHYSYAMMGLLLNKRATILSRNHQIAMHRNSIIFTGKTKVNWDTLAALPRCYSAASNNGLSYIASAIGGYYGGIENFELYIRYIQLGVFSPMLILASDDGKYYKREPWRWDTSQLNIIKKYLTLRNKLIPYIYTECYIYYKSGSPLIQPLYYKYPKIYDEPLYKNQYFFGSQMLVCPITKKKNIVMDRVVQRLFIPEGTWYELESGKKYLGNKYYMSFYKDEDYPVFCKSGSIIVTSRDNSVELPVNMEIIVFPGSNGSYKLYEDDGISLNYKNNSFSLTKYQFNYNANSYELIIQNTGNPGLLPDFRNYLIRFKNSKISTVNVSVGNNAIQSKVYLNQNDLIVEIENIPSSQIVKVTCQNNEAIENSLIKVINDDIREILEDLEIETILKEKIDTILFSNLPIKKKRIAIRKLKRAKLEPKFINMFLNLLEYIQTV